LKLFSSKRRWATAAVIVLLLFLLRPGASRLKSRIIVSISSAVGRPVDVGSVQIRLLPRPGFDLENLVVYDDADYGAEPILRAGEVTAALRLTSLVRGRLEIARLDMTDPSLNLVRAPNGHWNLETLVERTAHLPLAPTAKAKLERRPAFPYIEGTSGRINFMDGREKKPYTLTNADFSLWQDAEDAWGVRLKAQPVRTDLNLNDTGILRVDGTWQRASGLRDTPLNFSIEWDRPQLGQLTKLISGIDQGWRGGVHLDVKLSGTPAKLGVTSDSSIQDFRRYDITNGDALGLAAHCEAQYSSVDRVFSEIACNAPVGGGLISLKGSVGLPGRHDYNLVLNAERVPATALLALIRRAKKNLPDDLVAQGTLRGNITLERNEALSTRRFEGRGEIEKFSLASATNNAEIAPETIPFTLSDRFSSRFAATSRMFHKKFPGMTFPQGPLVVLGPFSPQVGKLTAGGWIDRAGYEMLLAGDSEIGKTLVAARLIGMPALQTAATGDAQSDLQMRGSWPAWGGGSQNFSEPHVVGTIKLKNVRVPLRGTEAPAEVLSAEMQLLPDSVRVEKVSAKAANSAWTGSLEMPRGCGTPAQCTIHFNIKTNQVALADLNAWARPRPKERPWYRVLESNAAPPSFFSSLRALGRITAERLLIHNLAATHVAANVSLNNGSLKLADLSADFLGGKYRGDWQTDFHVKPEISSGSGTFSGVSLAYLAQGMKDPWIAGTASGTYELTSKAASAADFWQAAEGSLRFQARNGTLLHISLEDQRPLTFASFSGVARLRAREIEIKDATLDGNDGTFQVSGTASNKRELQMKLARRVNGPPQTFAISGTLADPHVLLLSNPEQARLKR